MDDENAKAERDYESVRSAKALIDKGNASIRYFKSIADSDRVLMMWEPGGVEAMGHMSNARECYSQAKSLLDKIENPFFVVADIIEIVTPLLEQLRLDAYIPNDEGKGNDETSNAN